MICAFSSCHHKASDSDSEQSILGVVSSLESSDESDESEPIKSKNESDSKSSSKPRIKSQKKKGNGKELEISAKNMSNPTDLMKLLEARQQTLSVQSEKRNVICRALQCQWLLIQKKLGMCIVYICICIFAL
jgi:hypothetical protein